jgi:Fe-S cluster assembly protein SufD
MQNLDNIKINFDSFIESFKGDSNDIEFRKKSFNHFLSNGFPKPKDEQWKYSPLTKDLNKFLNVEFGKSAEQNFPKELKENYDHYPIFFIDGNLQLDSVQGNELKIVKNEKFLKSVKKEGTNPVLNFTNAFANEGYLIEVEPNTIISKPIVVYNFYSKKFSSNFVSIKNFILVNENSEITIFEKNIYNSDQEYLITSNTEVFLAKKSKLKKYNLNEENKYSTIFNFTKANLDEESELEHFTFSKNINSCRDETIINLNGKKSFASVSGIQSLLDNNNHEIKLIINHNEELTESSQFIKSALHNSSTAAFQGKIFVDSQAQKTDGYQLSRALLLSDKARFFSKPELEIYADDVKCSHGSSSGSIDDESIFYLRSRGINETDAKEMMIKGFLAEVIDKLKDVHFKKIFFTKLGHDSENV